MHNPCQYHLGLSSHSACMPSRGKPQHATHPLRRYRLPPSPALAGPASRGSKACDTLCNVATWPEQRSLRDRHAGSQGVSYARRKHVDVCTSTPPVSQKRAFSLACMACTGLIVPASGIAEGKLMGQVKITDSDVHGAERTCMLSFKSKHPSLHAWLALASQV